MHVADSQQVQASPSAVRAALGRLVLLGPPASGKGTQAELIRAHYGYPITSPGAMLREERRLGTELGLEADRLTSQGSLLPDSIIVGLVASWMEAHNSHFIFDGFPRTRGQADALRQLLEQRGTPLQIAIALETPLEVLQSRVASRLVCSGCGQIVALGLHVGSLAEPCPKCGGTLGRRTDDTPETLAHRLEEYREKTEPLLSYYEEEGLLHRVCSTRSPAEVFAEIRALLGEPLTPHP